MYKKISLFFLITVGILVALYVYLQQPSEGEIFFSSEIESPNKSNGAESVASKQESTSCFTVTSSNISSVKIEDTQKECVLRAMLVKPLGQVALTVKKETDTNSLTLLEDETGVSLRKNDPEKYQLVEVIQELPTVLGASGSAEFETAVFLHQTEIVGFFKHTPTGKLIAISVHNVAAVNDEVKAEFWKLVASVVLL